MDIRKRPFRPLILLACVGVITWDSASLVQRCSEEQTKADLFGMQFCALEDHAGAATWFEVSIRNTAPLAYTLRIPARTDVFLPVSVWDNNELVSKPRLSPGCFDCNAPALELRLLVLEPGASQRFDFKALDRLDASLLRPDQQYRAQLGEFFYFRKSGPVQKAGAGSFSALVMPLGLRLSNLEFRP